MARQRKGKRVTRATVMLDEETARLLEAWRNQNCIGKGSRSRAIKAVLATYLGVRGWKCGMPGFGIAWDQSGPWKMQDPRTKELSTHIQPAEPTVKLRLV